MSSSPGSDVTPGGGFRLRWDVFLSFRGEDTRESFTKSLYESLQSVGVRAFMDDEGLERGDEIAPSLIEAIHDSAASIVILSPRYADSHWCLEELATICHCRRLLIPVFYRVDPSHVRKQAGPFEPGFRSHEVRFAQQRENISRWREAMYRVGGIAGLVFNGRSSSLLPQLNFPFFISVIILFLIACITQNDKHTRSITWWIQQLWQF